MILDYAISLPPSGVPYFAKAKGLKLPLSGFLSARVLGGL